MSEVKPKTETGYRRWVNGRYEYLCPACVIRLNRPMKEVERWADDEKPRSCEGCGVTTIGTVEF